MAAEPLQRFSSGAPAAMEHSLSDRHRIAPRIPPLALPALNTLSRQKCLTISHQPRETIDQIEQKSLLLEFIGSLLLFDMHVQAVHDPQTRSVYLVVLFYSSMKRSSCGTIGLSQLPHMRLRLKLLPNTPWHAMTKVKQSTTGP
jgi:hypothetical protein